MTQEDKQLLLVDICARLPYGVICQMEDELIINDSPFYDYTLSERHIELFRRHKGFYIKPYLRPMSSMTAEEQKEFVKFHCTTLCPIVMNSALTVENEASMIDWLNAHHFDFRNLLAKGLAIEVTEDNNPYIID